MTDSQPHPNPPTPKQLRYLRDLAISRGMTFVMPATATEASDQIDLLRTRRRSSRADRAAERFGARVIADHSAPATDIRPGEVEGYGSTARWR